MAFVTELVLVSASSSSIFELSFDKDMYLVLFFANVSLQRIRIYDYVPHILLTPINHYAAIDLRQKQ